MKPILTLSTGGTFNKHYSEESGEIAIDTEAGTIQELSEKWRFSLTLQTLIGKDSLDMTDTDRALLLDTIRSSIYDDIIVIHGTDTMDLTAISLAEATLSKRIILTGAMIPYHVDPVEATANYAMAYGYLQTPNLPNGIYISMNGIIADYTIVKKDRKEKCFKLFNT